MNILASLVRVIFSIIVLLAIACYLQATPSVSLSDFCLFIEPAQLVQLLSGFNAVTVTLVIILLLGILSFTRVLEAAWNILFCGAILILLAAALYFIGGPELALPNALYHNDAVLQFCQLLGTYHVPFAIAGLIFAAGWLCASACGRVAITTVISFGLWYGLTEFFTYIVHQWAKSADPSMPEALYMVQGSPWIIAAVPGAFFLIYALLMAFFETFITKAPKVNQTETKSETKDDKINIIIAEPVEQATDTKKDTKEEKKAAEPAPQKKLKPATSAPAAEAVKDVPAEKAETDAEKPAPAEAAEATPPAQVEADKDSIPASKETEVEQKSTASEEKPEKAAEEPKSEPVTKE